ncbi:MAG: hypothetical protein ABIH47_05200, partial [Candidatus Omnitrophota bacterium]
MNTAKAQRKEHPRGAKQKGKFLLSGFVCILFFLMLFFFLVRPLFAQNVPRRINFQGLLTNTPTGTPKTGTFSFVVRIYDLETGGTAVFTEQHDDVLIISRDNGAFNLEIGAVNALNLDFNTPYWITIQVIDSDGETDGELTPRQRIVSAGYAINADLLDGIDSLQLVRSDEDDIMNANLTVTGSIDVIGSIRGAIDPGSGVEYDTFTIDAPQDSSDIIALIFGRTNDERLYYSLIEDEFHLTDGLSISGGLTISGLARLNSGIDVNGAQFTVSPTGAVHTDTTLDVDGQTTLNGGVDLGDSPLDMISLLGEVDSDLTFDGARVIYTDNGDLTVNPAGDILLGVGSDDTILSGDLTVGGNDVYSLTALAMRFSGANVQILGNCTVSGRGGLILQGIGADVTFGQGEFLENDQNGQIGIGGNVSISGDMTVFGTGASRIQNGRLYVGSGTPTNVADDSGDLYVSEDVEIEGDLSIGGDLTLKQGDVYGAAGAVRIRGDLTVTDTLFTDRIDDEIGQGLLILTDTTVQSDLTIGGGQLYSSGDLLINPQQGGASVLNLGVYSEGDYVIIGGDLTIMGNLSVGGSIPPVLQLYGTSADSFTIDSLDTSTTPTLVFEDSDGDETFRWNDLISSFELSDDLSLGGSLTLEKELIVQGGDVSRFSQGRVYIGSGTPSSLASGSGDLYVEGDGEVRRDLSIGGDLTLGGSLFPGAGGGLIFNEDLTIKGILYVDNIIHDDTAALTLGDNRQQVVIDSSDWDISAAGDMNNIGDITADGTLFLTASTGSAHLSVSGSTELGDGPGDTHSIRGVTTFGTGDTVTISDSGDLTVSDNVWLGDDVTDIFMVTSSGLNVSSDGSISDAGGAVRLDGDVTITGELSIDGELEVNGAGISRFDQGRVYIGSTNPSALAAQSGDLYVEEDVEIGWNASIGKNLTVGGNLFGDDGGIVVQGDLTVTGTLFTDRIDVETGNGLSIVSDTTIESDLTVSGGEIYSPGNMLINPQQGGSAVLFLGQEGEGDEVRVEGSLTISNNLTVEAGGYIWGQFTITGTTSDSFTIDDDNTADTPALIFEDGISDESLQWNDIIESFELSDDLSLAGDLTIEKRLHVMGAGGRSYFSGTGHTVEISDGNLEIYDAGGGFTPTSGFDDAGDLVVGEDLEIGGDLSIGGDITLAGVIFSDDYTQIMGSLTVGDDLDVRGRIYDGAGTAVDILDNLSVSGDLTIWGSDIFIGVNGGVDDQIRFEDGSESLLWDESESRFSFTDTIHSTDTFIVGGTNITTPGYNVIASSATISPSTLMNVSNDLYVEGDVEIGGDLSLGKDVTIIGVVFSDDYTQIVGPLTTGDDLDVRGQIYDGAGTAVDILDDLSVSGDLSVWGSDIYVGGAGGGDDSLWFSGGQRRLYWDETQNEFRFADNVNISGSLTASAGAIIGDSLSDIFTLISSGLNVLQDGRLYDTDSALEVQDDLSISGDLTVLGSTRLGDSTTDSFILLSSGLNIAEDGTITDADSAVRVDDDLSITGELSVGDSIIVNSFGISRFSNGRVYIGNLDPSPLVTGSGDLYVEADVEIRNDLSVGGDVTIAGDLTILGMVTVPDLAGTASDSFTIDLDDTTDTPTLAFADADGAETFRWNDLTLNNSNSFELSDDLSVSGSLTTEQELIVNGSGVSRFSGGRVYIGNGTPSTLVQQSGDLYVTGDVEIGGDLSLGKDTTIAGVIFSDDYTQIVGPLTASNDIDIRGQIYDGAGAAVDVGDDLSISGDLTVWGSDIYVGGTGGDDDSLWFSGGQRQLYWDEGQSRFQFTDNVNISGSLTVSEGAVIGDATTDIFALTSSGLNVIQNGTLYDNDSALEVQDD